MYYIIYMQGFKKKQYEQNKNEFRCMPSDY